MRLAVLILAALTTAAAAQGVAPAQTTATAAQPGIGLGAKCHGPINVSADSFEGDLQTKVGTYIGNVIVVQADCRLRADKVVAEAEKGNDLNRLTATGHVVFNSSSGTATGDAGVYELGPKTITLTGKVVLTKGRDVMRGTNLVVDINTGLAHLTAKGMPGGRVQSSFTPDEHKPQSPPKPKADATN